jgi:glyoxylase-like metal-dependent hydrolase (beta-lactamase superfamily II)
MPETTLSQISNHVYWMSPGQPDRPSLAAVVGSQYTVMLDAGASADHVQLFLKALKEQSISLPDYIALTHWHWDHIFGAAEIGKPLLAHAATAEQLLLMKDYSWDDTALDQRVASGEEIAFCADNIKLELPEPRDISIVLPDMVFHDRLDLHLGDVICSIQHVGGDHAADSCVIHIMPDRVLFLGDCLYDAIYTPKRHYTTQKLFPLLDKILSFDAEHYVEGHNRVVLSRPEIEALAAKMRLAGNLVDQIGSDELAVLAALEAPDEEMIEFVQLFLAGR